MGKSIRKIDLVWQTSYIIHSFGALWAETTKRENMATQKRFDWDNAKRQILTITNSNATEDAKKNDIESFLKSLPFGINLNNHDFRYHSCGYPYWATHRKIKTDSFRLREILDQQFDPETFDTDYLCPCCKRLV